MKERHAIVCATHLLLCREGEVLLARRFNTGWEDGNYSVPAGHVDEGEPISLALIREAKEEIGIDIKPEAIKLVHALHRNKSESNDERLDFFFSCEEWDGELANMEPDKCDDLAWFKPGGLPQNMVPYVKWGIEQTLLKNPYSELYW